MDHYKAQQYDCCYVFNGKFRKAVEQFDAPASVNLINSDRLLDLNLEMRKLNSSMKLEEIRGTRIIDFLPSIKPFWDLWPRVRRIPSELLKLRRP